MTPAKYMTKKEKKLYRRYLSELHITNLYQLTYYRAKKIPRTISLSTNTSKKPSTNFLHMLCSLKKGL